MLFVHITMYFALGILFILQTYYLCVDYHQTFGIFLQPMRWREKNPVIRWVVATMGLRGLSAYFLLWVFAPLAWELVVFHHGVWGKVAGFAWPFIVLVVELRTVRANRSIGL